MPFVQGRQPHFGDFKGKKKAEMLALVHFFLCVQYTQHNLRHFVYSCSSASNALISVLTLFVLHFALPSFSFNEL